MKLGLKVIVFAFAILCFVKTARSVPVAPKDVTKSAENSSKESEDPCNLKELENIPTCVKNDENCNKEILQKRAERETLCEKHPNCSYCGKLIPGNLTNASEELIVIEPEIIPPINSESDYESESSDDQEPQKLIERNIIIENDNETQYYRGFIESGANITTIIRLTNLIKNENIINMPTTLNNTNINNIHVYNNKSSVEGGKFGLGYNEDGPCCYRVEQANCKQSTSGQKCRHKKRRVCGQMCTSKIIHKNKNLCSYSPQWPYVVCPNNQQQQQGFYPPAFYPQQPGFGFYPPAFYPQNPSSIDEFDDEEDLPLFPDDDLIENPESGWVVGPEKCKIVSEDGLQIFNCTNKGFEFEHPYARNTVSESLRRDTRHAVHPRSQQQPQPFPNQQMPFYPVVFQPVMMQPMPYVMPQFYPQQPQPYFDSDNDETQESNAYRKPRRHSRKNHPIIMDNDDEL